MSSLAKLNLASFFQIYTMTSEMTNQLKMLTIKPDDMNWIPRITE